MLYQAAGGGGGGGGGGGVGVRVGTATPIASVSSHGGKEGATASSYLLLT